MKYYQENTFEEGFRLGAQIILEAINRDIPISGNISIFVYTQKSGMKTKILMMSNKQQW